MARGHGRQCIGYALACGTLALAGCFMEGYAGLISQDGGEARFDSGPAEDDADLDAGLVSASDSATADVGLTMPADAEPEASVVPSGCQGDPLICSFECSEQESCVPPCATGAARCDNRCGSSATCKNVCPSGSTCDFDCDTAGRCEVICEPGSDCSVQCGSQGECFVECLAGATCALTCAPTSGMCKYTRCANTMLTITALLCPP